MKKTLMTVVALAAATLSAPALANVDAPADAHYKWLRERLRLSDLRVRRRLPVALPRAHGQPLL
jgi:hypothetical protein